MARLLRAAYGALHFFSTSSKALTYNHCNSLLQSRNAVSSFVFQSRFYTTDSITKSPFESNILRILHNEVEYQSEYAPPHQPATMFDSFTVQDRPGEQWMTMNGTYNDSEDIKLEVTMFDGYETVARTGEDASGEDIRLHISVLVDVKKGDGSELEFVCSAWPDCLEIQKVYLLRREKMLGRPYLGPAFKGLNLELQKRFREFLDARGINDNLAFFLHEYTLNKDRIELLRWFGKVKSFVEK